MATILPKGWIPAPPQRGQALPDGSGAAQHSHAGPAASAESSSPHLEQNADSFVAERQQTQHGG